MSEQEKTEKALEEAIKLIEDMLNELTPPLVTLDPDSKFAKMVTGYYKRLIALKETGE